jgi:hypothetical protein
LLSLLSEIYDIWTNCREYTAVGSVGRLAITRKCLPSGLGLARYQATSTPQRARHNNLLGIITSGFNIIYQLLIRSFEFVKC